MLDKFFIIVTMMTPNSQQFGTDMFAFEKPYETKQVCVDRLKSNPSKYFQAAYKNFQGRLQPDKAYCISGEVLKKVLETDIENKGT